MHPAQLRVLPYARSAPGLDKARSQTPVLALVPGGGGRAWPGFETTRRAKLAARTASGRAAAPGRQHADKQENTSSTDGERSARSAADGKRAARSAADGKRAARSAADGKRAARSAGFETTRRAKLAARASRRHAERSSRRGRRAGGPSQRPAARTPSGRAERAAHGTDAEQAGQANGPRRGRRAGGPSGQLTARTASGRAAAPRHQHAEHAHTTRPGPAAPNSAEDPGLVKQSDQAVHHEGGECFERSLDLALGQRGERCDSVIGPGARKFARLIEHVVGAQAFHNRGEGLVGG